ncbi:GNAT family N-acetyltransferase [Actinoplanes sp. NPDC026670]|uniref:GNAT family N-acetyltransferase n=1 Tax=Actinoplanes sp. NPDC026670 TaxID=3154700 RepID=UPI0033E98F53
MAEFRVSAASADDVRVIAGWAVAEGWNPGDGDESAFHPADPGGFLVGRLDGQPITSISAIRYGTGHGFIGLYLTVPEFRGRGFGYRTWQAGMERLAGRNIGLDGVVAQQDNYRKSGFQQAWTTTRYQGVLGGLQRDSGIEVTDARSVGFGDLAAYDRRFFPAERDAFLALWITLPGRRAVVARRGGTIVGFAARRPAGDVDRIGPLFADSPETAETLLAALSVPEGVRPTGTELIGGGTALLGGGVVPPGGDDVPVMIDMPADHPVANQLAERAGLKAAWDTARMYTGGVPQIDRSGIYAVTSLELG